jgi:urease accessory protein
MGDWMYLETAGSDLRPGAQPRLQRASGQVRIGFRQRHGQTRLERLFQDGCAKARLPKTLPGETPEGILINTAGGLTGGDRLATEIDLATGATATVTTQACERIYRSTGGPATVSTRLRIAAEAKLAWLPQETILFDGGRLKRTLEADIGRDGELVAVEAVLFGRQAMGEQVRAGAFHDSWRIRREGRLVFADDLRFEGSVAEQLARSAALGGGCALATVLYLGGEPARMLDAVRAAIGEDGGASAWDGKLLARLCAADGLALRRRLESVLKIVIGGRALPKVWQI